jgi:hypothetical protein
VLDRKITDDNRASDLVEALKAMDEDSAQEEKPRTRVKVRVEEEEEEDEDEDEFVAVPNRN